MLITLLPDGFVPVWVPWWLFLAAQIAVVAIIVGGIVGGLTSIVAGAWRVIRYTV